VIRDHDVRAAIDVRRRRALDAEPPLRRDPRGHPPEAAHPATAPTHVGAIEQGHDPQHRQPQHEQGREADVGEHTEDSAAHRGAL
jgi:hypothetical protein